MTFDRMSPADVAFLHIEDGVSHMHIGSVGIFEGPFPGYEKVKAMFAGKLPLVPRYRQVVRDGAARAGPAGVGRRPALQHRLPRPPHRAPEARRRGRAAPARRPADVAAARPDEAAVGGVGRRGPRERSVVDRLQDPPLHGRRRVGHRPAVDRDGPLPRRLAAGPRRLAPGPAPTPRAAGGARPSSRWPAARTSRCAACARHPAPPPGARAGGDVVARRAVDVEPAPRARPSRRSTVRSDRTVATSGRRARSTTSRRSARASAARSTTSSSPRSPAASAT